MRKTGTLRRPLACLLAACLLVTLLPVSALAAEYPCGHIHDGDCGYAEAVEGSPCAHQNEDGTYACAPADGGADYVCAHTDDCGYQEAAAGAPCTHRCELCAPEPEPEPDPESAPYDEALALFAVLPAPEAVADMSDGEKDALAAQIGAATDALFALPDGDYEQFMAEHGDYMELVAVLQAALTGGVQTLADGHTHCVCGGSVKTGGHTGHSDLTWTAWTETTSLPTSAGNYYLTQNVALTAAWTVPTGTVNLCLNGKTVTGSGIKSITSTLYVCVDIPGGAALAVCDCGSGGGMSFTPGNQNGSAGIYGGAGSSFTLYGGGVSASKSASAVVYALHNSGGTFAVHSGTVSATHGSSGGNMTPFAWGVYTDAGTTTLWGGSFEAKVTNTTSYNYGSSGANGARVQGTGVLRLAGVPAFTTSNSANNKNAAAISALNNQPYAHAEDTPFSGDSVSIQVSSSIASNGGLVIREVEESNKEKFTVTNTTSLTLTEVTEGDKTHLALTGPYTVKFNANNGTGTAPADLLFTGYTHSQALTANPFTKEGYRFTGWNTKQDGTGTAYADQATVSGLAYGGTVTLYAQWVEAAPPHSHDMSVECGKENPVTFDKALTSQNGQLYIDGTAVQKFTSDYNYYVIPAGSYYLPADVELDGYISIKGTDELPTEVNLCLNGHKLVYSGSQGRVIDISIGALSLCDCNGSNGSHAITSRATGESVTVSGGVVTGATDSGIYLSYDDATLQLYGGTIAGNGGTAASGGGVRNDRGKFVMHGGSIRHNLGNYGGGVYSEGSLTIAGGEITDNRAQRGAGGVNATTGTSITLSGAPVISGNVAGTTGYTFVNNLVLKARIVITVGENFAPTTPIGVTTAMTPTQESPVPITGANGADYSRYFKSDDDAYVIRNGPDNVVQLALPKSNDATLSVLSYKVGTDGSETAVSNFTAGTDTYDVTLPVGTSATANIALSGTPAVGASITTNDGVTLVNGSGTATVIVTAEDGTTTRTYTVNFVTIPAAPAATEAVIDYKNETVSFADTLQMNTKEDFTGTAIPSGDSITNYIANYNAPPQTLYIRVKAAADAPASAATAVTVPARPRISSLGSWIANYYNLTLTVTAYSGVEYTIDQWSNTYTGNHTYTGLEPNTGYTICYRMAATESSFRSSPDETSFHTRVKIQAPTVEGEDKGSASADTTIQETGKTVTYTVTFTDGWTPTLTLSGNHNTLSGPVKGDNNTWTYTYTAHKDDKTVGAKVTFAVRQAASISYTGESVALFADSAHNASADALKAYLDENVKVTPTYDNGTTGEGVAAGYALKTGTWSAQGGTYTYTATVNGQTCDVPVTVQAVNAAVGAVDGITKVRRTEGYADHAALGLPETVAVTYTGEGYEKRTEDLTVSWSEIPADFGKSPGSQNFTGTVTLPAWATGGSTTSATVTISDKTALTEGQMTLSMDGWTYGEEAKTPQGAVTITGDNGNITYQYSADNGGTWTDALPLSTADAVRAGDYLVKMSYEGDGYVGEKTASFTVAQKPVTLGVGTLAASKPYDGTDAATLSGAPEVTGALEGDDVSATGGSGTYARTDAGTGIAVAATGFTLTGADGGNYAADGAVSGLTGTITPAEGTHSPGYADALAELQKVHIVTNVTPSLEGVTLPDGWTFTGDRTARLTAKSENGGRQSFPVRYTPESANYAPVTLTGDNALFPVSTVALEVDGGLDMRTIERIGGTLTLSPVALEVTGAALPASGDYAITNMEWSSSVPKIATVAGSVAASNMTATITAKAKGVTMVGVAYQNGGGMLGYVLVQVVGDRTDSANTVADLTAITETLDKLIDPESPSATDKAAVDAVADEVTKLPNEAKEALTVEDVKALDELKQAVGGNISDEDQKLTITIKGDPEGQVPAPSNVEVVGAAIACGVPSGEVVVTVRPVPPTGSDTKLELKMELTVDDAKAELAAPMFFQMDVPEGIDLAKLTLYHVKDDGGKTALPYVKGEGRTISFKMMSFSSVRFVVSAGGGTSGGSSGGGTSGGGDDGGGTSVYTLTATAGGGGKIAPGGRVRVNRNGDKTFAITPDEGYEIADVLVDGRSVGAVSTYTFEKVKANHTISASFRAEDERPAWNPFADVAEGAWYYNSVKYVYERGWMDGTGETTFSPGLSTTRGMIVTILWRLEKERSSGAAMTFEDVEAGSYCYEAVRWAAEHGIVKGYTAASFGPEDAITRQELAVILHRYAQYSGMDVSGTGDLAAFPDRPDPWAEDAVKWAVGAGVLTGRGGGVLDPRGRASRAEAAAVLQRFAERNAM